MFLESKVKRGEATGWIEVICGSMFSGKTEELIRRLKRARIAKLSVEIFKPALDTRYDHEAVVSHDENRIVSTPVNSASAILMYAAEADVIGIDEAQFFDEELPAVCSQLAGMGKRVIVAGLDMDYLGKPFGPIPNLLAIAEHVTKVHAICISCGNLANHSHRMVDNKQRVLLGETDVYQPLCRQCFSREMKNNSD